MGQRKAVAMLRRVGAGGKAFWFAGPSGTGKTTMARLLAESFAEPWNTTEIDAQDCTLDFVRDIQACPRTDFRGAFNHCTLDGEPARIIGRSYHYATIEPHDVDAESIRVCWDVAAHILDECDGAFVRSDDDTDE